MAYSLHLCQLTEGVQLTYVSEERVHNLLHLTEYSLYLYELAEVTCLIPTAKGHKTYGY
jgi:hypothetical protein